MSGFESLLAGRTLGGRYLIEALIGRGGMGAVYRAADERLGRAVAVKVVSPPGGTTAATRDSLRSRFQREARAAARLHHPNVVTIHDFGTDAALDLDFLVMALLHGDDLATRLAAGPAPSPEEAAAILRGAARGLAAGHRAGLVHRDVKPGNLFLCATDDGAAADVRVLDFGIAQVAPDDGGTVTHFTQLGQAPLSPAYASPEQLRGDTRLTPAADVYGLGAIGHQLLTGERAFTEDEVRRIAAGERVRTRLPEDAGSPLAAPVGQVVARALAYDPADRFPDAGAFLDALEAAIEGRPPGPAPRIVLPFPTGAPADHTQVASTRPSSPGATSAGAKPGTGAPARGAASAAAAPTSATGLRPCAECGHSISRNAAHCPSCGAPASVAAGKGRRGWRGILLGLLAFLAGGAAVAGVLYALGMASGFGIARRGAGGDTISALDSLARGAATVQPAPVVPVHVPAPEWAVENVASDESCSSMFDACLRVRCTVANTGDAAGDVVVTARILGRKAHRQDRQVRVEPGQREILFFDFPEVKNGERFREVTCHPEPVADDEAQAPATDTARIDPEAGPEPYFPPRQEPTDTLEM